MIRKCHRQRKHVSLLYDVLACKYFYHYSDKQHYFWTYPGFHGAKDRPETALIQAAFETMDQHKRLPLQRFQQIAAM